MVHSGDSRRKILILHWNWLYLSRDGKNSIFVNFLTKTTLFLTSLFWVTFPNKIRKFLTGWQPCVTLSCKGQCYIVVPISWCQIIQPCRLQEGVHIISILAMFAVLCQSYYGRDTLTLVTCEPEPSELSNPYDTCWFLAANAARASTCIIWIL